MIYKRGRTYWYKSRSPDSRGDVVNLRIDPVNEAVSTIEIRVLNDEHGVMARKVFDFASADGQLRIAEQPAAG